MHSDEIDITESLVKYLISEQFPHWATLPIKPVQSSGTSNAIFRLSDAMAVRMPRIPSVAENIAREFEWLPKLAAHLPYPVPIPLAMGEPSENYPWDWSICQWVEGENPVEGQLMKPHVFAKELAKFIRALHEIKIEGGPESFRGRPLVVQNEEAQIAIKELHGKINTERALSIWNECLKIPAWKGKSVWIHGDLMPGNLLVKNNSLSAVIDFGCFGTGDPACDLISAWNLFDTQSREIFKKELQVDEATWLRGQGWALSMALIQLPYYEYTNPVMAANARYTINQVVSSV